MPSLLSLFFVAIMIFLVVINILGILSASARRNTDISSRGILAPGEVMPIIQRLRASGFERLGEAEPVNSKQGTQIWVYVDPPRTTFAEVAATKNRINVEFDSAFPDEAWLQTVYSISYPTPPIVNSQNLRLHKVTSSIEDAYADHRSQLADFATKHGQPVTFNQMNDYITQDGIYRTRYARRIFIGATWFMGIFLPIIWIIAVLTEPTGRKLGNPIPSIAEIISLLLFVGVPMWYSMRGNQQKAKMKRNSPDNLPQMPG